MDIQLYHNNSENNVINKSITGISTPSCVVKKPCSEINPVIILHSFENMSYCNYAYIEEFNRYYFIDDIIPLTGSEVQLNLRVDVLESFKDSILGLNAIIEKQENIGNKYFNDGSFNVLAREFLTTYNFPAGFDDNGEFILITCGG